MTAPIPDVEALSRQIAMLAEYFGAALEPHVLRVYVDGLRDLPTELLRGACRRLVLQATFMPKVAEIRAAAEAVQTEAQATAKRLAQASARVLPAHLKPFGRMSKNAVLQHWHGFEAGPCDCVACWDAQPPGPPRFVPEGVAPAPVCPRCEDTGWSHTSERTDAQAPGVTRCGCARDNPNLVEGTRAHTIEMGRWLHGPELVEWYAAKQGFEDRMRAVLALSRLGRG
jgi:hypothetical protein